MAAPELETPPVGEEIHLPGPSLLPITGAVGITLAIVGITLGSLLTIVGLVLFLVTTVNWIASTRRDIGELPPEHTSH